MQSKLIVALTLSATEDASATAGDDASTVGKFRLNTKDFVQLIRDAAGDQTIKTAVLQRTTDAANDKGAAVPPQLDILNTGGAVTDNKIVFLDGANPPVAIPVPAFTQKRINLNAATLAGGGSPTLFDEAASGIRDASAADPISARRDIALFGTEWAINGGADDLTLDLFSRTAGNARRKIASNGDNLGLQFVRRDADVSGGAAANYTLGSGPSVSFAGGIASGTISATAEK